MDLPENYCHGDSPYTRYLPSLPTLDVSPATAGKSQTNLLCSPPKSAPLSGIEAIARSPTEWEYRDRNKAQLVAPSIFLGPSFIAKHPELLQQLRIGFVLIFRRATKRFTTHVHPSALQICRSAGIGIELIDVEDYQQLAAKFASTSNLLNNVISSAPDRGVLVCCDSGNDVSAAVVVAHIMTSHHVEMLHAIRLVQTHRFCICIGSDLLQLLDAYQEILRARADLIDTTAWMRDQSSADQQSDVQLKQPRNSKRPLRPQDHKTTRDEGDEDDEEVARYLDRRFVPFANS